MKEHENRRITQTKRYIQESLILLMESKSIYKISIKELCDRAGINRSTFYNHYKSQIEVFDELEKDYLDSINELYRTEKMGLNPGEAIVELLKYMEKNLAVSRLLLGNKVDPEFFSKLKKITKCQDAIEAMRRFVPAEEFDETANFCLAGCYAILREWINKKENRKSPEEIARLISTLSRNLCNYGK
ncbi:MAG: TetR/AcrR family transcriptional regulator C-terminal domain-containing protein [Spirochaetales bacterium]|nr:TetR/AcrR family transcriptional regulator C-terminal domain-containing protein [Spirochaetales bacterium]